MLKVQNRNSRTRWEISLKLTIKTPERRHWPWSDVFIFNFTYFTVYSSVSIAEFEQVNFCQEHTLWVFIYPRVERRHRYTVFFVNFEQISHLVLVFLCLILSMHLIAQFNISVVFRLRWIQTKIHRSEMFSTKSNAHPLDSLSKQDMFIANFNINCNASFLYFFFIF